MKKAILALMFLVVPLANAAGNKTVDEKAYNNAEKYSFSEDWFSQNIPVWSELLDSFKGKPNVRYLEIGVFEGRSLIWMLENILTHPTAEATGIDIFPENLKQICLANLKQSGSLDKVTLITGRSQYELRKLPLASFDLIYIDGSHNPEDVETDAVLSWLLLKDGGVMIFDDYSWDTNLPQDSKPKISIDCFITIYRNEIERLYKGYQVIITKKQRKISGSLRIGPYEYKRGWRWKRGRLFDTGTKKEMEISDIEQAAIERLFNERKFGEIKFSLTAEESNDENFIKLKKKLKLSDIF